MDADEQQTIFEEKSRRIRGCTEGRHAPRTCPKNHPGPWGHEFEEISPRQTGLFGGVKIRPARGVQVAGEYADAVGTSAQREGAVPHHRSDQFCERNPVGGGAAVHCPVGYDVDHDAKGKARPAAF